jgi:colanic acid/amylovoran biosynthesis glycosyltransferase
MEHSASLAVLPQLRARITPNGGVILTQKFIDGMEKYAEYWDGPVTAFMEPTEVASSNLDEVESDRAKLPFKVEVVSFADPKLTQLLASHRLVLGSVCYEQNGLADLCRSIGVPCIYVAEYSLKTRFQIVHSDVTNPVISLRRQWWEFGQERRRRRAIRVASGIQCNGTPTFDAYRSINANPLLFFDSRVTEDMVIDEASLVERAEAVNPGAPLRLLFSGRFIPMKGVDHLVPVAANLRRLGVSFEMTICGGGELEPRIKADIERLMLGDCVKLAGVLDFKTELIPLTKHSADLFICCHRTGDPSCTYLEAMSCGVPIVGYDNEAFRGIVRESAVGWLAPMNRPEQVAETIAKLSKDRAVLLDAGSQAAEFGRRHTFERTFKARIEHMNSCSAPTKACPMAT